MSAALPSRPPRSTHLLYLHGFRSSPQSAKARRMADWVASERPDDLVFACPQLPPSPAAAIALVEELIRDWPRETMAVMGSSLGGFYATVLSERLRPARTVLLNPAVDPARDLAAYIGEQHCWQDPAQHFYFRPEFVDELRALAPGALAQPQRYCAVIAKGDELLDWREMLARYQACRVLLLEGSDHGLSDFDEHLPSLIDFLNL
ncbi:YqiA/YcfP family alpha/beta fold hydrolase [Roseateles violae]|uniref:YqiA/YcfP family alpha/beta fold hydrolase n=1 Tax=Roseateles violae TaxID=3058042 RepID=A0ABT8DRS2_9BURK|nr:YqiA/YcfP family alpha/beta fold hydrolase [Pelomonas sp. PFR6]MDN3921040.1 YqiA/YcfP family alpha/beta fold hydrolase [Pelomonas sp. PFR6]